MIKNGGVKVYVVCAVTGIPLRVYLNSESASSCVRRLNKQAGCETHFWLEKDLITSKNIMIGR